MRRFRLVAMVVVLMGVGLAGLLAGSHATSAGAVVAQPVTATSIEAPVFSAVGNTGADVLVDVIGQATGGLRRGYWPSWEIPSAPGTVPLRRVVYTDNRLPSGRKALVINGAGKQPTSSDAHLFDGSLSDAAVWSAVDPMAAMAFATTTHRALAENLVSEFLAHGYKARMLDGEVVGISGAHFKFVLVTNRLLPTRLVIVSVPEAQLPAGFYQPWTRPGLVTEPSVARRALAATRARSAERRGA